MAFQNEYLEGYEQFWKSFQGRILDGTIAQIDIRQLRETVPDISDDEFSRLMNEALTEVTTDPDRYFNNANEGVNSVVITNNVRTADGSYQVVWDGTMQDGSGDALPSMDYYASAVGYIPENLQGGEGWQDALAGYIDDQWQIFKNEAESGYIQDDDGNPVDIELGFVVT